MSGNQTDSLDTLISSLGQTKRKNVSKAYQHYTATSETNDCHYCTKKYRRSTSTCNLMEHVRKHHPEKIIESKEPKPVVTAGNNKEARIELAITRYFIENIFPISHYESSSFRDFAHSTACGYKIKSGETVKQNVLETYVAYKFLLRNILQENQTRFSLSFKVETKEGLKGFCSATLHWVDKVKGQLLDTILDFFDVGTGSNVGVNIAEYLLDLLRFFRIEENLIAIVSDNSPDAIAAAQILLRSLNSESQCVHLRCFSDTFHSAIKESFNGLEKTTQKLQNLLCSFYHPLGRKRALQKLFREKYSKSIEEILPLPNFDDTWTSMYSFLKRCLTYREDIMALFTHYSPEFSIYQISDNEWKDIVDLTDLLAFPLKVTGFSEGSKFPGISEALLAYSLLINHFTEHLKIDCKIISLASSEVLKSLGSYSTSVESTPAKVIQLLDLRIPFQIPSVQKSSEDVLRNLLSHERYKLSVVKRNTQDLAMELWDQLQSKMTGQVPLERNELDDFLSYPRMRSSKCPVLIWMDKKTHLPNLFEIAMDYFGVSASTIPVDPNNSVTRNIARDNDTSSTLFRAEICSRDWGKNLKAWGIKIPAQLAVFINTINVNWNEESFKDDIILEYISKRNVKTDSA